MRGDSDESIVLYKANGAPPALPAPECAFTGAVGGKFSGPAWSQDGQTLAWQEGNGIWSAQVPDVANCATIGASQLIVAGGSEPDFGPAAMNPGARPACGNPGNPAKCPTPGPPPPGPEHRPAVQVAHQLNVLLSSIAGKRKRLAIHGLLHKRQIAVVWRAPAAGVLTLTLSTTGKHAIVLGRGRFVFTAARKRTVVLKLSRKGLRALRHARQLHGLLSVTFAPRGAPKRSAKLRVSIA